MHRLTAAAFVALTGIAGSAMAQSQPGMTVRDALGNEAPVRYVEIPGSMEFTGMMVVQIRQDLYGNEPVRSLGGGLAAAGQRSIAPMSEARQRLLAHAVEHFADVDQYVVRVPEGMNENTYSAQLMATGDYEYAEPDWRCYLAIEPNDPLFGNQYHHDRMNNELAWAIETGDPAVILAIVDSGIDIDHPDLDDRLVPGFNAVTNTAEVSGGLVDDTQTSFGHGTFCAGMAGAEGNNGFGTTGVAWNISLMPIKVTSGNNNFASSSDLDQGARWAADNGARVVNVSFSGVQSASAQTTGAYVEARGGVYFRSAGNDGQASLNFEHPAVVVVGATTSSNARANFSNTGPGLDLMAPGASVRCAARGGGTLTSSGTSFSSPAAAGVAALMFSANPLLSPQQVKDILYQTAVDLGAPGEDNSFGRGLVDAAAAVAAAAGTEVPDPAVITGQPVSTTVCQGETAVLTVTATGTDLEYQWLDVFLNPIPGETSSSFTITNAQPSDAGFFFVEVSNSLGSVLSNTAQIAVNPDPAITQQPVSQTVNEGDPVSFSVTATAADSFQWRFNGSNIGGATSATLNIASASLGDAGAYTVRVTNTCGTVTSTAAQLTVNEAPSDCLADVNGDGVVSPSDFSAWVAAFNAGAPEADQNGDGAVTPADFSAWVNNFNAGC